MPGIIESILDEHEAVRGHMKMVGDSMRDWANSLKASPGAQSEVIAKKQQHFLQTMGYLRDGLKRHHVREEKVMLPLIGERLLEGLRVEHEDMLGQLSRIDLLLGDAGPGELVTNRDQLVKEINSLCSFVSEHSLKEDIILGLLKKAPRS